MRSEDSFEDDDFLYGFSGGGITLSVFPPTPEQMEAEKSARAKLFGEDPFSGSTEKHIQFMLNSPMFQNNDGFTAMNDTYPTSSLDEMYETNQNSGTSELDEFYKELDVT